MGLVQMIQCIVFVCVMYTFSLEGKTLALWSGKDKNVYLSKDMRPSDVLIQADWHPLSYCYKLALLRLMHKLFHDEFPQVLSDNLVMKHSTGYSL